MRSRAPSSPSLMFGRSYIVTGRGRAGAGVGPSAARPSPALGAACSFDAFIDRYELGDPALAVLTSGRARRSGCRTGWPRTSRREKTSTLALPRRGGIETLHQRHALREDLMVVG